MSSPDILQWLAVHGDGNRGSGGHRLGRRLLGLAVTACASGCVTGIPRVDGAPIAPPAPDRLWSAPRAARFADSLGAADATQPTSLTLGDAVELALRNNPATRASWAQARASADAYGSALASYWP